MVLGSTSGTAKEPFFLRVYRPETFQKHEKSDKWLPASRASEPKCLYFCVRNIFFYTNQKTRNSWKKLYWLRASRNLLYFVLVWNQKLARKTHKWLWASRTFRTFVPETFFFLHRPENQKIKNLKVILIASEPKFVLFWGLKNMILLNICW